MSKSELLPWLHLTWTKESLRIMLSVPTEQDCLFLLNTEHLTKAGINDTVCKPPYLMESCAQRVVIRSASMWRLCSCPRCLNSTGRSYRLELMESLYLLSSESQDYQSSVQTDPGSWKQDFLALWCLICILIPTHFWMNGSTASFPWLPEFRWERRSSCLCSPRETWSLSKCSEAHLELLHQVTADQCMWFARGTPGSFFILKSVSGSHTA